MKVKRVNEEKNLLNINEKVAAHIKRLTKRYPELLSVNDDILSAFSMIRTAYTNGGKLLVCGNGGSAADAEHIVGELMKGFHKKRELDLAEQKLYGEKSVYMQGALPAIALTQNLALSTAFANDVKADMVFAQQVYGYGEDKDVFLGISTSGDSKNVVNAAEVAKAKGIKVIALTGRQGGVLKDISDICIQAPAEATADIQELHLPIYHTLCAMLEEYFF